MAERQKLVPRDPAPSTGRSLTSRGGRLPDDLVGEQVQRLMLFSLVVGGLWLVGLLVGEVMNSTFLTYPPDAHARIRIIALLGIIVSGLMVAFLRYASSSADRKMHVGLLYLVGNAAGIAAMNTWVSGPPPTISHQVSWIPVLLLVYSMLAPAAPRPMLTASLVAALMDPIGVWFAYLRGVTVEGPIATIVLFWPNYVCAVLTIIPSRFMEGLGRKLRKAREMGSYELLGLLGHGGMGEVWEARHRLLARRAAVKLVRPEILGAGNDAEAGTVLRRFEREAQATAALSSPHTIQVFDFGVTDQGIFYYVMELLAGRDLESLVREFGPIPAARVGYLLRQVCHSLADAHAHGLVHRDIKPANIYVCRMGLEYDFVKVLDFGLVKMSAQRSTVAADTLLTADQRTTGTPAYMAPEIILGQADVDQRADVYALGCVAYYLLTGQLVFEADTPMKMLMQHVQAAPLPPSRRTELPIPPELDALVLACLEKDPDKRPQNARVVFTMACGCRSGDDWNSDLAAAWWKLHLPQLTGPLVIGDLSREAV